MGRERRKGGSIGAVTYEAKKKKENLDRWVAKVDNRFGYEKWTKTKGFIKTKRNGHKGGVYVSSLMNLKKKAKFAS